MRRLLKIAFQGGAAAVALAALAAGWGILCFGPLVLAVTFGNLPARAGAVLWLLFCGGATYALEERWDELRGQSA